MKNNSKKKLYATRTVKLCSFFLVLILSVSALQQLFLKRIDQNSLRIDGYYLEDSDTLDVVLLGASDVYTGFSSGRAYQEFGFTSYPYATQSMTAAGTLTALKEVVRTQNAGLILIEINAFLYGKDVNESKEANIRKLIDNVPMNQNKIEFISKNIPLDEQIEYYLPIIKYHSLWKDYPWQMRMVSSKIKQDIRGTSYFKGYRTTATVFKPEEKILNGKIANENKTKKLNPTLEARLRELLDYCKSNNLNVAFFRVPHLVYNKTYDRVKRANTAGEIIKSYGYDFINLERDWEKIGINTDTDFYNYDHLNVYGAQKLTDHLGKIIVDKYGVTPHKLTESQKEEWNDAAEFFNKIYRYSDYVIKNNLKPVKIEENEPTLETLKGF